ncbi:hypothetical protein TB1_001200 [Malus domestica]
MGNGVSSGGRLSSLNYLFWEWRGSKTGCHNAQAAPGSVSSLLTPTKPSTTERTRLSTTPAPKLGGSITLISEARSRRSMRSDSPASSDVSRLTSRKKFNVFASPSYWLQQIKLSEAAGKYSTSLGFFQTSHGRLMKLEKQAEVQAAATDSNQHPVVPSSTSSPRLLACTTTSTPAIPARLDQIH